MFASPRPAAHPSHPASTLRSGRRRRIGAGLLALGLALVGTTPVRAAFTAASDDGTGAGAITDPAAAYGQLPLSFEANHGQTDPAVKYLTHGRGYDLFITPTETVMALHGPAADSADTGTAEPATDAALRMSMVGANPDPQVSGADRLPGRVNYLRGDDPAGWHTDIPTYRRVNLEGVYPGVDVAWYGGPDGLEYDVVVAAGADHGIIRLAVEGASGPLRLDDLGQLIVETAAGTVVQRAPVAYQQTAAARTPVDSSYVLVGDDQVGFSVGAYDPSLPLVIDPVLDYSTYLGGSRFVDEGNGIAVDSAGAAYVTGHTDSTDFPTTPGAFDTTHNGGRDAFVTKLDPAGSALVYSTYLGGSGGDFGGDVAVDGSGSAYVTGSTDSADFPTTPGAFDTTYNGGFDAFVAKVDPTGSALVYSTYLGSSGDDFGSDVAVDGSGSAYVTGFTDSADFPTTPGAFDTTHNGGRDALVTKLDPAGSALVYSTYLGSSGDDFGSDVAVDGSGSAYITGSTDSADFPTTPGAFDTTYNGGFDAFVAKLNPTGSALVYSTYLGGSGDDFGSGAAIDGSGSAYITGSTDSADFPTTPGAFDTTFNDFDAFVSKLNPTGNALVYSTYLGGSEFDSGNGVAVDGSGSAYVTGGTGSADFPTTPGAFDTTFNDFDAFVTKLNPTGSALVYSTYLGGSGGDSGDDVAVDGSGSAYITGGTDSADFPTTPGAFDTTYNGGVTDAFVAKIALVADLAVAKTGPAEATVGTAFDYTVTVTNAGPDTADGVVVTDTLPAGVTFVAATPSQGGPCTEAGGVVTCPLGSIADGGAATVTITVVPTAPGTIVNTATATSAVTDPDPDDNTATADTTVVAAPPDLGRVVIRKVVEGTFDLGATFPFTSDLDGDAGDGVDFTLAADEVFDSGPIDPGVYSVAEVVPAGWELSGDECSDGSPPAAIDVAAGETVTCTFTNRLVDEDDDDPYDTYDDDPGAPGFDFDSPFGDAGDPAAPGTDSPVDVAVAGVPADSPQGGGPAGAQPDVAGEQLSDSDHQSDGGPALFGELPRTGAGVAEVALAGAALLALGCLTVVLGRKRRATA